MNFENQIKAWVKEDVERYEALKSASRLELNEWCIAAGFIRNLVWDKLHAKQKLTPLDDLDLIYFDKENCSKERDLEFEAYLKSVSHFPWSVKNQARMHIRNSDRPYISTENAMSFWVEVETAVGITLNSKNELEIIAPFGVAPLFQNTITMNKRRAKPKDFENRITSKQWLQKWPNLSLNA